jgi:glycosyltransferase involved in cell wall biosynthesis
MSGIARDKFAEDLQDSFLSVWIDELSGFGTFPIESMKCNTPVVGKIPRMVPEWMGTADENGNMVLKDNGVWTGNINSLPDVVATMVGLFLEGGIPDHITSNMGETAKNYTTEELVTNVSKTYNEIVTSREAELTVLLQQAEENENKTEESVNQ